MIDKITEDKVKSAANVKDVIGDFYKLKKNGVNYECLCPFHADRSLGSFKISESKNIYYCFSCGAKGDSVEFLMKHENMKYFDAIKWLGAKYGIDVEGADEYKAKVKAAKPHEPTPPRPMLVMPLDWVKAKQVGVGDNILVRWLLKLKWAPEQAKRIIPTLNNYKVGHAKSGHTIFWQIDEQGRVRSGKTMLYKPDGHRDKENKFATNWIHSIMYKAKQLDPMDADFTSCYFGQHLMNLCPEATINIVESEKTALICTIAYGNMKRQLWLACGGKKFLNEDKLQALIKAKRHIVLYPDRDSIDEWKEIANGIKYEHITVNSKIVTDYWRPEDGDKADIADIIIRMLTPTKTDFDKLCDQNEAVAMLRDLFDLEIVQR